MKDTTSALKSIQIGTIGAMLETSLNHILWSLKTRQQARLPPTLDPRILSRGLIPHVLTRIPTTSLQMLASNHGQDHVFSRVESKSTRSILAGLAGGVAAATLQTPVELTMTFQQREGKTFWYQINHIRKTHGIAALSTGYLGTAIRLGLYTCSFFSIQPLLKNKLQKDFAMSDIPAHIGATLLTGPFSTILSNPNDVIKTIQQSELPKRKLTMINAAKEVYEQHGVMGFFKGTLARNVRVCSGIAIISGVNACMK